MAADCPGSPGRLHYPADAVRRAKITNAFPDSAAVVSVHYTRRVGEYLATNVLLRRSCRAAGLTPAKQFLPTLTARCAPYIAGRITLLGWMPRMRSPPPGLAIVSMAAPDSGARWWLELRARWPAAPAGPTQDIPSDRSAPGERPGGAWFLRSMKVRCWRCSHRTRRYP